MARIESKKKQEDKKHNMQEFKRVLISNRGEIVVRVIRALDALGIESVAVYSDPDASSPYLTYADKAYRLPGSYSADTYLNQEKMIELALRTECDAIHPGYGFLAESAEFSQLCRDNSIKFIGPNPEALRLSENKLECKKIVESNGVPVIPYSPEPVENAEDAARTATDIGYPVLLKAAYGGGGKGIKEAKSRKEVKEAFESSEREAKEAFGRFSVYIEKKITGPRHIEVQVLASDDSREAIHLGERECTIQRRYQKLVEMTPSPVVDEEARKKITGYALRAASAVHYSNAGTCEFLRDSSTGNFYYMEMNSRLQVEHGITELLTGVDMVVSQIQVASRNKLPLSQSSISFRGCAIECRINAEDPLSGFSPTTGEIEYMRLPGGSGIRVDTALAEGALVSPFYDSLIAKLMAWGQDFDQARKRALTALREFAIVGVDSTIPFHMEVLSDPAFSAGQFDTGFVDEAGIIPRLRQRVNEEETTPEKFAIAAFLLSKSQLGEPGRPPVGQAPQSSRRTGIQGRGRFIDAI